MTGRDLNLLGETLGDEHDLVILRARLRDHPEPGVTPADLDTFAAVVDHRRAAWHAKAGRIGQRIHREKPGGFEDRRRGFWQVTQTWKRSAWAVVEQTA